jgi:hypothetical protein
MFDTILEGFRKTSESTLRVQQDMVKQLTQQWSSFPTTAGTASTEQIQNFQKRWTHLLLETMKKQRQSLDSLYQSGIEMFEQFLRLSDAKSPEECRRAADELWRKFFEVSKVQSEAQFREAQEWAVKSFEMTQQNGRS